jgi:hypothetical protein
MAAWRRVIVFEEAGTGKSWWTIVALLSGCPFSIGTSEDVELPFSTGL